jgi:hypothetical protein
MEEMTGGRGARPASASPEGPEVVERAEDGAADGQPAGCGNVGLPDGGISGQKATIIQYPLLCVFFAY